MISIFRRIRHKLAGKYAVYAIGEILLVVAGILIALQVNNWNEARVAKEYELTVVSQLLEDALLDSSFFQNRLDILEIEKKKFNEVLSLEQKDGELSENLRADLYAMAPFFARYVYQSYVMNNSSEALRELSSEELKKTLREFKLRHGYVGEAVELYNRLNEEIAIPLDIRFYEEYAPLDSTFSRSEVNDFLVSARVQSATFRLRAFVDTAENQINTFLEKVNELIAATRAYKKVLEG